MVAVYAMMNVIRDSGVLNRISQAFGGNFKPGLMYNAKGLIMMNLWFNIPFAALIITSALASIPDSIIEGARDVGANVWQVFVKMILPLSIKDCLLYTSRGSKRLCLCVEKINLLRKNEIRLADRISKKRRRNISV